MSLLTALDELALLRRIAGRMYVYGLLSSMVDTTNNEAKSQYEAGVAAEAKVEAAVAHVEDQIRKIGDTQVRHWLKSEPKLQIHRRRVTQIFREGKYQTSRDATELIKALQPLPRSSGDLYFSLFNSASGWKSIKNEKGEDVRIDPDGFASLRRSKIPEIREASVKAYFGRLRELEDVFGLMLTRRISGDIALSRARNFKDSFGPLLAKEGIPDDAHRVMIEAFKANREVFVQFLDLRRRALGLDRLDYFDTGLSLPIASSQKFSLDESKELVFKSTSFLGQEYRDNLQKLMARPWLHWEPRDNKRDDYGIWYSIGGSLPYGFMLYTDDYRSSTDFAGLAALLAAYGNIPQDRPTDTRLDPAIYSNALVFAGNVLHVDELIRTAKTDDERLLYLMRAGARIFQTARDTLITELQLQIQELIDQGRTPAGADISALYLKLMRDYFPGLTVDDAFAAEWMNSSLHFYSCEDMNFPLAMAAACELVSKARSGDERAKAAFYKVLGRGESDYSYDLLKASGVDLARPNAYDGLFRRLKSIMLEIEGLLAKRDRNGSSVDT